MFNLIQGYAGLCEAFSSREIAANSVAPFSCLVNRAE